jgi:hypothetical protein
VEVTRIDYFLYLPKFKLLNTDSEPMIRLPDISWFIHKPAISVHEMGKQALICPLNANFIPFTTF